MDCIQTRLLIVLNSRDPHQLDSDARAALDQHLEQCAACLAWSLQEDRVDGTLRQAIQAVPVPATLETRIQGALAQQRRPPRSPWIAAAAACLFVAVALGGYFWLTQRTELHFADIADDAGYVALTSAEAVEASFADQGMPILAPRGFNYNLYTWSGLVTLKGSQVPRIDFFHPGDNQTTAAVAHVYVIPEDRFDVQDLAGSVPSPTPANNHVIEVLRFGGHPGFIYIAVFTGGSLRPIFLPQPEA
jgi:hypothetical protein